MHSPVTDKAITVQKCLLDSSGGCCSEDFLRQTEYGYGEENLGADDLSDLRAAADGHGPFAKYK